MEPREVIYAGLGTRDYVFTIDNNIIAWRATNEVFVLNLWKLKDDSTLCKLIENKTPFYIENVATNNRAKVVYKETSGYHFKWRVQPIDTDHEEWGMKIIEKATPEKLKLKDATIRYFRRTEHI